MFFGQLITDAWGLKQKPEDSKGTVEVFHILLNALWASMSKRLTPRVCLVATKSWCPVQLVKSRLMVAGGSAWQAYA